MIESLNMVRKQELEQKDYDQKLDNFIREFVQADSKYGLFIIL
jgi:translation initiation factor 2 beta subunit (eIF-2beta)/eIF-5